MKELIFDWLHISGRVLERKNIFDEFKSITAWFAF